MLCLDIPREQDILDPLSETLKMVEELDSMLGD